MFDQQVRCVIIGVCIHVTALNNVIIIKRILFTCRIHKSFESMLQCSIECQRAWRVV
jgi:hypothetical protein